MKQAYFRTECREKEEKVTEELKTIELIISEYINLQDSLLSEALILTDEMYQNTPHFLPKNFNFEFEDCEESLDTCLQYTGFIKKLLGRALDIENSIVNQYKAYIERNKSVKTAYQKLCVENKALVEENELLMRKKCARCDGEDECGWEDTDKYKNMYSRLQKDYGKLQRECLSFNNMYNELKLAHEELLEELKSDFNATYSNESIQKILKDKEKLAIEHREITRVKSSLEQTCAELSKKLEQEQLKSSKIQKSFDSYLEDNQSKQLTIEKAQVIIKKLNNECETLAQELSKAEAEISYLRNESRGTEQTWVEVRKKVQEFEIMKNTEERLREENRSIKSKLMELAEIKDAEVSHLNQTLAALMFEKKNLENDMEDLEEKLNEIDVMNKERVFLYTNACDRIRDLEEIIKEKDQEFEKIAHAFKIKEETRDAETQDWKKHAENLIRHLQASLSELQHRHSLTEAKNPQNSLSNRSALTPSPEISSGLSQVKVQDLSNRLEQALQREASMKSLLNNLIEKESKFISDSLRSSRYLHDDLNRELEKWIMKNEELEQKSLILIEKCDKLLIVIKEMEKVIEIKEDQLQDQQKIHEQEITNLQSNCDFMKQEKKRLEDIVITEIFPKSQQTVDSTLHLAHTKIQSSLQDAERMKIEFEENKLKLERVSLKLESSQAELCGINKKISQLEGDISILDRIAGQGMGKQEIDMSSALFSSQCKEILKKIQELQYYNSKLIESRVEAMSLLENRETEKSLLKKELALAAESFACREKTLKEDSLRLVEENKYLKDIALREKEEKIRIKAHLGEEEEFFNSQIELFKQRLSANEGDKLQLESEIQKQRKDFSDLSTRLEKITAEKRILQNCYEELNEKIWTNTEREKIDRGLLTPRMQTRPEQHK